MIINSTEVATTSNFLSADTDQGRYDKDQDGQDDQHQNV
jgi:hypothetical protein